MRGRKPKPTVLKKLHQSQYPINEKEPIPEAELSVGSDSVPAHFNAEMRADWAYALAKSPPHMLKAIDAGVLECWVTAHYFHRQAVKALLAEGKIVVLAGPKSEQLVQSPHLPIINRQALIMMRAASELGFSPTARPRIGLTLGGGELNGPSNAPAHGEESIDQYLARAPRAAPVH